jgi:hypothetical protein
MSFNLSKTRHPISKLRSLRDEFLSLRPSDLDGLPDDEVNNLVEHFTKKKTASIGGQPTTFKGYDSDPTETRLNVDERIKGLKYWMGGGQRYDWPGTSDNTTKWENPDEQLRGDPYGRDDYNPVIERAKLEEVVPEHSPRPKTKGPRSPTTRKRRKQWSLKA